MCPACVSYYSATYLFSSARKTVVPQLSTPSELVQTNPFSTPRTLVNHLIHNSPVLTELLVTREWLQDTAPPPQPVESATAYRNFTRLNILHGQRVGSPSRQANLVKELDPDVTIREPGSSLAGEDAVNTLPCVSKQMN